jgi:hypothetical protein
VSQNSDEIPPISSGPPHFAVTLDTIDIKREEKGGEMTQEVVAGLRFLASQNLQLASLASFGR